MPLEVKIRVYPGSDLIREVILCGPLRISAFSALMSYFNAEATEIRRGPQRKSKSGHYLYPWLLDWCENGRRVVSDTDSEAGVWTETGETFDTREVEPQP